MCWDEDREIIYHLPCQANQSQLGENQFNLLPIKIQWHREKQRQNKTPSTHFFQAQLHSIIPNASTFSPSPEQFRRLRSVHSFFFTVFCASGESFSGLQSFKINLLQCGCFMGYSSFQTRLPAPRAAGEFLLQHLECLLPPFSYYSQGYSSLILVPFLKKCLSGIFLLFFLNKLSQRHPHLDWWAQLWPAVGPLEPSGTSWGWHGEALASSHRGHPTANACPPTPSTVYWRNKETKLSFPFVSVMPTFLLLARYADSILTYCN